ncbi:MAG: DUF2784 domain-containing protein [Betaproteobacteria bacterium]
MIARICADALVAIHFAFIVFVLAGGLLTLRHRRWALLHVPAVGWAAFTEFTATICPLTPWENSLRRAAGDAGYPGGFIDHYVIPLIYPQGLRPEVQLVLGAVVVALNVAIYALVVRKWNGARGADAAPSRPRPSGRQASRST